MLAASAQALLCRSGGFCGPGDHRHLRRSLVVCSVHGALLWVRRTRFVSAGRELRLKFGPRNSELRALDHCYSGWNCAGERGLPFSSATGTNTDSYRWSSDLLEGRLVLLRGMMIKSHGAC